MRIGAPGGLGYTYLTPMERATKQRALDRLHRRGFLAAAAFFPLAAPAQQPPPAEPPVRRDWSQPQGYPDPDIVAADPRFPKYIIFNTPLQRLHTGDFWTEGPAWNGTGRYLVWSDIPNNLQRRWLEEDGHVSVFRNPSGFSNGNTFDYQGRQVSCEHGNRRVARYEPDGTVTTIADRYNGKRLNSPNDVVVHPSGAIYFTDPPYGILGDYEGYRAEPELKEAVYRVDPAGGRVTLLTDEIDRPNGLCFSPDYKLLYVTDTGKGANVKVWEVTGDGALRNGRAFASPGGDGIRCDVDGNIWSASSPGVRIIAPSGEVIGTIRLPETCGNVCFGGGRRNRLFMTASRSLYAIYVGVKGAHIA